jgi:hypothetical protein
MTCNIFILDKEREVVRILGLFPKKVIYIRVNESNDIVMPLKVQKATLLMLPSEIISIFYDWMATEHLDSNMII